MVRVLVVFWLLLAAQTSAWAELRLPARGEISLASHWALLLDPQSSLTVAQVAQPEMAARFSAQIGEPALGYKQGTAWLRITVTRPTLATAQWWLELRSALLNEATLFIPQGDGRYEQRAAGNHPPFAGRDVAYRNPVFRLDLPADQPMTLYLRVRSSSTMTFALILWSPDAFVAATGAEQLLFGLFFAVPLLVIMTCLWFYRTTRDVSYLLFSLVVLANLLSSLAYEGFVYQYLLGNQPAWNEALHVFSWLMASPLAVMFTCHYLGLFKSTWRRLAFSLTLFSSGLSLVSAPLILLDMAAWLRPLNLLWGLALTLLMLVLAALMARRGHHPARALLLALGILSALILLRLTRNLGLLDPGIFVDNAHYLGNVAYLMVMNSGINLRYAEMRREKESAQAEALNVARQAGLVLELKVHERTLALQQSMSRIAESLAVERRARDEQEQLLATVSHELRTPLAVIDATAQNLELDDLQGDPVTLARYKKILRATERLTLLLEDSLNENRFELLRQGVSIRPTDLAALLKDAAHSAWILSQGHHFKLETDKLPSVFLCDPNLLSLVLRSLADNAVKYAPPDSEVILSGHTTANGVELVVADNGPGISTADLPHLFERFYRGQNVANQPGTGLGLALARRMVEMQGGTLRLESSPGQGCRVTIFLPDGQNKP